jgi:hypothetical protein
MSPIQVDIFEWRCGIDEVRHAPISWKLIASAVGKDNKTVKFAMKQTLQGRDEEREHPERFHHGSREVTLPQFRIDLAAHQSRVRGRTIPTEANDPSLEDRDVASLIVVQSNVLRERFQTEGQFEGLQHPVRTITEGWDFDPFPEELMTKRPLNLPLLEEKRSVVNRDRRGRGGRSGRGSARASSRGRRVIGPRASGDGSNTDEEIE